MRTTMWIAGADLPGDGNPEVVHNPATEEALAEAFVGFPDGVANPTWTAAPSASPGGIHTVNRVSLMDRIKHEACPADGGGMSMLRSPEVDR